MNYRSWCFLQKQFEVSSSVEFPVVFKAPKSDACSPTWSWWLPSVPCLDALSRLVFDRGMQYRSSRPLLLLRIKQSWVLSQLSEAKEDASCRKLSRQACSNTRELLLNKVDLLLFVPLCVPPKIAGPGQVLFDCSGNLSGHRAGAWMTVLYMFRFF